MYVPKFFTPETFMKLNDALNYILENHTIVNVTVAIRSDLCIIKDTLWLFDLGVGLMVLASDMR
jgi:hypothetical protein